MDAVKGPQWLQFSDLLMLELRRSPFGSLSISINFACWPSVCQIMLDFTLKRAFWKVITPCTRISCYRLWFVRNKLKTWSTACNKCMYTRQTRKGCLCCTGPLETLIPSVASIPSHKHWLKWRITYLWSLVTPLRHYVTTPCLEKPVHRTRLLQSSSLATIIHSNQKNTIIQKDGFIA